MIQQLTQQALRILKRRQHYRHTFETPSGKWSLADLRRFCKATEVPIVLGKDGHTDLYASGVAAGRQEVFWYIAKHLNLDDSQLTKLTEEVLYDE